MTPVGLRELGENRFQFVDGYSIHVFVFAATGCLGEPTETDEAAPLWVGLDAIPYAEMWEDDSLWLPLVLEGRSFSGRFLFDGRRRIGVGEPQRHDQVRKPRHCLPDLHLHGSPGAKEDRAPPAPVVLQNQCSR